MVLYNTLTRCKEQFKTADGSDTVRIYSCGPTVYSSPHIGNVSAYIFVDVLKKTLEFARFKVHDVMNITDVGHLVSDEDEGEDKIEKAARAQKITPQQIAERYTAEFFSDCAKLNIRPPKILCKASEYIPQMIEFIKKLEKKGFTYKTSDGLYFDSSKFPDYEKLTGPRASGNRAGERVNMGEKRGAQDFALWKFVGENTLQKWESPWGVGCPGWHIECSVMAHKHLSEPFANPTFDIHTGGIDHIPVHHTNEIVQTESVTGAPMCNFWCHNEHIKVDGGKMSKSLGNIYTISDLERRGFSPMAYRYYNLLKSYRTMLNFTFDGLTAAQTAYNKICERLAKHKTAPSGGAAAKETATALLAEFKEAVTDDLATPRAIATLQKAIKQPLSREIYDVVLTMDKVLSLGLK